MTSRPFPPRATARGGFFRSLRAAALLACLVNVGHTRPFVPQDDDVVLARVPAGVRHTEAATLRAARARVDVALPLAQLYIRQARSSGDLRYLGYAEAVLEPWIGPSAKSVEALVLQATVLQSRHEFSQALGVLNRARELRPDDPQAWLTTATVLRVRGEYDGALAACDQLSARANAGVVQLCRQGVLGLTGSLSSAYSRIAAIPSRELPVEERAWRDSELAEMAVRMGQDEAAEQWFRSGLRYSPGDFYMRAGYADLLLRQHRAAEALELLRGEDSLEPLLLRIAVAQKTLHDPGLARSRERLAAAFAAEEQRGDGVHCREQARFLLDVVGDPRAAVAVAQHNWAVQREPEDVLILVRAARAAGIAEAAGRAAEFVHRHRLEDVRVTAAMDGPI